jgi:hypothetical protein
MGTANSISLFLVYGYPRTTKICSTAVAIAFANVVGSIPSLGLAAQLIYACAFLLDNI